LGLRLDLLSKQAKQSCGEKTELIEIERYSTTHVGYVNDFDSTLLHEKYTPNVTRMGNSIFFLSAYAR
jgi:hypothetical protein